MNLIEELSMQLEHAIERNKLDLDDSTAFCSNPDVFVRPFGRNSDYPGIYPIFIAVYKKCEQIVSLILENVPTMLDQADELGCTPLSIAVFDGNLPMVKLLISMKTDLLNQVLVFPYCSEQQTALHYAIENSKRDIFVYLAMVELLLDKDPRQLHQTDAYNRTPVLLAAFNGCFPMVLFLLQKGARIQGRCLPVDDIIDAVEQHDQADDFKIAICVLLRYNVWSINLFDAIVRSPRPEYLALACVLSHSHGTWSDAIGLALEAHPRPLSLAFAFFRLKSSRFWTEQYIRQMFQQEHPANVVCHWFLEDALKMVQKSSPVAPEFRREQAPFSVERHPDFSRSLAQARHYHGLFSAKRNMINVFNGWQQNQSQQHQNQEEATDAITHCGGLLRRFI